MNKLYKISIILLVSLLTTSFFYQQKPTLYIIGDSTVQNNNKEKWGWGTILVDYLDTNKIQVSNQAIPGRSTRTFLKEGRWSYIDSLLKPRDYVMMQFGHNDGAKPDTNKAGYRGVLKGIGEDTVVLTWPNGEKEIVHTYGWYIRKYVRDAKAKGAIPIVLSMIPRNIWVDGKVVLDDKDFGKWAKEVAKQEKVPFIDLNSLTAEKYNVMGADRVKDFFPVDHTHTDKVGAIINAESVVQGIRQLRNFSLNDYLIK
jgi:rhamnogalacturonan acetylesterase